MGVGDEGLERGCAFDTVNAGSAAVTGGQRVAHGVTVVILR